ncbi:MAG: hypothetical protein H8D56_05630 [Planctomycetes bacterium]|nr:hypothetical protein [Planctomycetota bacterium]MBL7146389.1 hypothetical protein [Phycisphaerae bacterium]
MDAEKIFVGRKAELEQFKKVLKDPTGQAVLVIGQACIGKTWLVNKMAEIAENHPELKCGCVRYEVTKEDSVDSRLAIMIDDAYEAASNPKKFWGGDDRGKKQWVALYKVLEAIPSAGKVFEAIRGLAKSLKRDISKDSRQQFVEKLKIISKKMPSNGRAIFIVDPEKYMRPGSDEAWAIVVKNLPGKIKFILAQRPEDVLVQSETFGALNNVSHIPEVRLDILDEESVEELLEQRMGEIKYSVTEVRKVLSHYEGHPYALQGSLDLLKAGMELEELPESPEPTKFAEVQWKKVCKSGSDAIRLFEAYSILEGKVHNEIIQEASGLDKTKTKSIFADNYIENLFREEAYGKRIYHEILVDRILHEIGAGEKIEYIMRAARCVFSKTQIGFFEKTRFVDFILNVECACYEIATELHKAFVNDEDLACYIYRRNEFKDVPNAKWLRFLREAGEFKDLEATEVTRLDQIKAGYLSELAEEKPKEVLDIILCSDAKDAVVKSRFLDVILKKPSEYISEGTMLINKYLDGRNYESWHFVGEQAAKFMGAIAKVDINKAFDVAKMLLEVWKREKKEVLSKDIDAKFKPHEYKDLVFKYYKKMWEADGIRAGKQLAEIFDNYLKEIGEDDYSVQNGFYVKLERVDQIEEKFNRDIIAIVVGGICEVGKAVIEKQPEKLNELLDYLWNLDKTIFERIVMYLLRLVHEGTQKERISSIIGNRKFLEHRYCSYEYRLLLRDKFEDVDEEAIQVFKTWVEEQIVDEEEKKSLSSWFKEREEREVTAKDIEQIENRTLSQL